MAGSDDWSTPTQLIEVLDNEFRFNLEVCAAKDNRALNPVIPYMGLDNDRDALTQSWNNGTTRTVAYCNPPYSKLPAFIEAAAGVHFKTSKIIVLLIPAYTDTKIWHEVIERQANEVRFLKGRLAFLMNGKKQTTARFPSAVVIFRPVKTSCSYKLWDWRSE